MHSLITIINAFRKIFDEPGRKPNTIWVDQAGDFYNRSIKPCLHDNNIKIYSTHNEGKSELSEPPRVGSACI